EGPNRARQRISAKRGPKVWVDRAGHAHRLPRQKHRSAPCRSGKASRSWQVASPARASTRDTTASRHSPSPHRPRPSIRWASAAAATRQQSMNAGPRNFPPCPLLSPVKHVFEQEATPTSENSIEEKSLSSQIG